MTKKAKQAPKKKDKTPATTVRLPPELRERAIKYANTLDRRTLTDVIIFALEAYLK